LSSDAFTSGRFPLIAGTHDGNPLILQIIIMIKTFMSAAALLLLCSPAAFASGPQEGAFSLSVFGGVDQPLSGDVHGRLDVSVMDIGPLNPDLEDLTADMQIRSSSYNDIYGPAISYGAELNYGLSGNSEIFGQARYIQSGGGAVEIGSILLAELAPATLPLEGTFSDYEAWTVEGGYRYYFAIDSMRPFVAGRIGATRTDDVRVRFEIPALNITSENLAFTEKKWVASAGIDVGLLIPVGESFSVTAQTGVRYSGDLEGDDSAIGGLGLGSINDTGKRVSYPVSVGLRYDF
jgi:hypothetical protein